MNVPTKLLKNNFDACAPTLHQVFNEIIRSSIFPNKLKLADVTPIFKNDDATNAKNYRPVSVIPGRLSEPHFWVGEGKTAPPPTLTFV